MEVFSGKSKAQRIRSDIEEDIETMAEDYIEEIYQDAKLISEMREIAC